MLVVCIILGLQQVALKSVADDMTPVLQLAIRSGIAAVLVALLMRLQGHAFTLTDGTLLPGLGLGILFTLEFWFLGEGLRYSSASRIVVFLYTAPIFTALLLHFLREDERLRAAQWGGIALAFLGIAIAFLYRADSSDAAITHALLWGDFLGLLAGLSWGLATVLVRNSSLAESPAVKPLLYQLVIATVLLCLLAVVFGQTQYTVTPALVANLVFQGVVVSFLCFLAWFALLKKYKASQLGVLSFMSPVFGVVFGVLLLNEPLEWVFVAGAILVITGILLVTAGPQLFKSKTV